MDESEVETACELAATQVVALIMSGQLPVNAWAFVRALDVAGHEDKAVIWTVIASPN